jgi:anaerobic sulfite reductase subunit C
MIEEYGVHTRGGVITELDPDLITVRLQVSAGNLTDQQLRGIASIAKRYGRGFVHVTTRQAVEIPHVDPGKMDRVARALAKNGTPLGSEHDEIVNIVACPGVERCKFGVVDTIRLGKKLNEALFGREMPVKTRISISGCPNSCTSPLLNEIGITGKITPLRTPGLCTGCGTCVRYCRENAITIKDGISVLDPEKCVECGVCIQSCPFHLLKSENRHYLITVGGRRGRHPRIGRVLTAVGDEDQVVKIVTLIIQWLYRRAWSGRHVSDQLDDLNFERFKEEVTSVVAERTATGTRD